MYDDLLQAVTELHAMLRRVEERLDQPERPDRVLKTKEAAQLLRIGEAELLSLVHGKKVPNWLAGNGYRYSERQLLAYVRQEATRTVNKAV